jgi:pimeloyl-ACP methyl ester carboxylesterase
VPAEQAEAFMAVLESAAYAETIEGYWRNILTGSRAEVAEQILNDLRATPPQTVRGVFRALWEYDLPTVAAGYAGPAQLVVTPFNTGPGSLTQLRPDWPAETVERSGHWLHLDRPEQLNQILDDFLASLREPVKD